jgi:shikimate dehydrogenase
MASPAEAAPLAGVLGWPIGHSRSPRLHGFWLREHGLAGAYVPMAVRPAALPAALRGLVALGFRGANVTLPHKEAALALVDEADAPARRIGAVNTIVVGPDGGLQGSNSDGYGFLTNLWAALPTWSPSSGPAVVLGAGGAARAVVVALLDAGAPAIRLANRTPERAEALRAALGDERVETMPWSVRAEGLNGAVLLVNTTTLGMHGHAALELPLDDLPQAAVVTDLVYAPLETPLLAAARARGNPAVDGLGMLLHQAVPGFAAWFGVEPAVTPALRAAVLDCATT